MAPKADHMKPIININGTSAERLVEIRLDARAKLNELMRALRETAPHPRDYPQSEGYQRDTAIYRRRIDMLDELYSELGEEVLDIQDQQTLRE